MNRDLIQYRADLIEAEEQAQENYDKTILTLSGGALGLSLTFIKDIIGEGTIVEISKLFIAWICWGGSVTVVLASFYFSHLALREAISQVTKGLINKRKPGGIWDNFTAILNPLGGILFVVGMIFMIIFVSQNLEL